jgi:hypothetical protein
MDDEATLSSDLEDTLEDHRRGAQGAQGNLVLSDQVGYVGDTITFRGRNCVPNQQFQLEWHSSQGRWGVLEANEVVGPQYQPRRETILTVTTDDSGEFDQEWEVDEDYGGAHTVQLQHMDGTAVDQASFEIKPWFEIDQTEAPLGEAFTITGYGIGPNVVTNNYQVAWDNGFLGFMTGVMNRGTATAQVRAVGPPGKHVIEMWRNYRGVPYLQNNTQSPYGPVGGDRQSRWTVEVTEPEEEPRTSWVDPLFDESPIDIHYPELDTQTEAELEISPSSGQAGTNAFIMGRNFPAEEEVDLLWYRHEGHRVKGIPITPEPHPEILPTVTADEDGSFQIEVEIPPEEGSTRPITAAVDGEEIAITGFMMQPDIQSYGPAEGPVGTEIEIELSGIGWTIYENAPFIVYDNKPLGYVCGTAGDDKEGVVRAKIPATGEPGWHFIDIYPSLFDMQEEKPEYEIRPHLSYLDNHPMRPLPGMHMSFKVTEE